MSDPKKLPCYVDFMISGMAGMAASCFTHPIDVVKNHMQMSGEGGKPKQYANTLDCVMKIIKNEGFFKLWRGLGAGLLRQATYTSGRLGLIQILVNRYRFVLNNSPQVGANLAMGITAGFVGAILGNPSEVALIRMITDANLPPEERRNYRNVLNALSRITKEEGIVGLYVGLTPSIIRSVVVSSVQLASYGKFKDYFQNSPLQLQNGLGLHVIASTLSGFIIAVVSKPFDLAKTRMQHMKIVPGKKPQYNGTTDALIKVSRAEGFLALWKGFTPYFLRIAPQTSLTLIFMEKFYNLYFKYFLGIEGGKNF